MQEPPGRLGSSQRGRPLPPTSLIPWQGCGSLALTTLAGWPAPGALLPCPACLQPPLEGPSWWLGSRPGLPGRLQAPVATMLAGLHNPMPIHLACVCNPPPPTVAGPPRPQEPPSVTGRWLPARRRPAPPPGAPGNSHAVLRPRAPAPRTQVRTVWGGKVELKVRDSASHHCPPCVGKLTSRGAGGQQPPRRAPHLTDARGALQLRTAPCLFCAAWLWH